MKSVIYSILILSIITFLGCQDNTAVDQLKKSQEELVKAKTEAAQATGSMVALKAEADRYKNELEALKKEVAGNSLSVIGNHAREFMRALNAYKTDTGNFPSTEQGLKVLLQPGKKDGQAYLKNIPMDSWGSEYQYTLGKGGYNLRSLGMDKKKGGTGENVDIIFSTAP